MSRNAAKNTKKIGSPPAGWEIENLVLKNVVKRYGDGHGGTINAINDISLTIKKGEFTTLVGPSGCGKTTTLRAVAGFESIDSGEIRLGDRIINNVPAFDREMPMVFQSYALFPHLSIYDNIAYGLKIRKKSKSTIRNDVEMILQLVNLVGLENRYPGEISGGQQQRVALARALVLKPKIILFDEPLSNLDAKLRLQTRMEIKRVQNLLGITTLYVTHDQEESLAMSDNIVVMNRGKIEQSGAPKEIYNRPKNIFVADFIGNSNFIEATVDEINDREVVLRLQNKPLSIPAAKAESDVRKGDIVYLSVKPEAVVLTKPDSAQEGFFVGKVVNSLFLGSAAEYEIEFDNLMITVIQSHDETDSTLFENGEQTALSFKINNVQVFKRR